MKLTIDEGELRALIRSVLAEELEAIEKARGRLPEEKMVFGEAEAARRLGLNQWQLRDERTRGRISFSRGPGRRIRYTRDDLLAYMTRTREPASE